MLLGKKAMNKRHQETVSYHEACMQRVKETPQPEQQKFKNGVHVKIADELGPYMIFFPSGKMATVHHTYAHAYQTTGERNLTQYCLDIDGYGLVSWYNEDQLTEA